MKYPAPTYLCDREEIAQLKVLRIQEITARQENNLRLANEINRKAIRIIRSLIDGGFDPEDIYDAVTE